MSFFVQFYRGGKLMRKADEMEKSQAYKSAAIAFVFYGIALLIYSIYLVVTTDKLGIHIIIFLLGQMVFFISNLIIRNRTK
jgi:hypothetical protein